MLPIGRVFEFFGCGPEKYTHLLVRLLLGKKVRFIDEDYEIGWAEFACCAFYRKLLPMDWLTPRIEGVCSIVFPCIKQNLVDLANGKADPLIALLVDDEFMLVGDTLLFDMKTWQQMDKTEFMEQDWNPQYSVCFMVSMIAIKAAERFLQQEPSYAPEIARSLQYPTLREALVNPESFASTLLVCVVDLWGMEPFQSQHDLWSPECFRMEFMDELQIEVPPENMDRLMAAISLVTTDDFFKRTPRFIQLCNIFAGDDYDPRVFNIADAEEICWGVAEGYLLAQPEEEEPFTAEIVAYMATVLKLEGILHPPMILRFLQDDLDLIADTDVFSGDADLFNVAYQEQTRRRDELNDMVMANWQELFGQIKSLQLQNGDAQKLTEKMLKGTNAR